MRFTVAEAVAATAGRLLRGDPADAFFGVTQDSREVRPGDLFVPVAGDRDGHAFVEAALESGATGYVSARGVVEEGGFAIGVTDTLVALADLGHAARERIPKLVAVTGSAGKTTTKDFLAAILDRRLTIGVAPGSHNNEIGMPMTLLNAPDDADVVIAEIGARNSGDVLWGARLLRPDVGIVTNVGSAHIGVFGSREAIAKTKGELVEALESGAVAVLNADDPLVLAMAERTVARVVTFGVRSDADVSATDVEVDEHLTARFRLVTQAGSVRCEIPAAGRHLVECAVAAAAAALNAGAGLDDIAAGLAEAPRSAHRMEVHHAEGGYRIINDAYNANPESMAAALEAARHMAGEGGRALAILGHMAELGDTAPDEHRRLGDLHREHGFDAVVAVGEHAEHVSEHVAEDARGAVARLEEIVGGFREGDVIVIKASRVVGLEEAMVHLLGNAEGEEQR